VGDSSSLQVAPAAHPTPHAPPPLPLNPSRRTPFRALQSVWLVCFASTMGRVELHERFFPKNITFSWRAIIKRSYFKNYNDDAKRLVYGHLSQRFISSGGGLDLFSA
jgi:hypothetical protein